MKLSAKALWITVAVATPLVALPIAASASGTTHTGCNYHVAPSQLVASLTANHRTYSSAGGRQHGTVSDSRPHTGERTVLPVLKTKMRGHTTWLLVRLPGRPNSHTGWIQAAHTNEGHLTWNIVVSTGERRACIYNQGKLVRDWLVVPGRPSQPTPHGHFFVEENIDFRTPPGQACLPGAPYTLATSARSNAFTAVYGGEGQVALHGMGCGLKAKPGTAVSHGCVRFVNRDITWLAHRIFPGTPVTITR
jgi:lipoprotein-anchoring transpeptidase ErfK/SrfK